MDHHEEILKIIDGRITQLNAQIQFLVDFLNTSGLLADGCFTFPDGETVYATKIKPFLVDQSVDHDHGEPTFLEE